LISDFLWTPWLAINSDWKWKKKEKTGASFISTFQWPIFLPLGNLENLLWHEFRKSVGKSTSCDDSSCREFAEWKYSS
jgi:hypothetical protein